MADGDERPMPGNAATDYVILGELGEEQTNTIALLLLNEKENLYVFHDGLAELGLDDAVEAGGQTRIRPVAAVRLRELLAQHRIVHKGTVDNHTPCAVPRDMPAAILARAPIWPRQLRRLRGIVRAPTLRRDGSLLDRPGHDRATKLYYAPDADLHVDVPPAPTQTDARGAAQRLVELLRDFPFADDAARSSMVSCLLTVVSREAFDHAPLFLIDATTPGTGKTLLAKAASLLAEGRVVAPSSWPGDEIEVRKMIFSSALSGARLMVIDNVERTLASPSLDALLTSSQVRDRLLGTHEMRDAMFETTVIATGNNISISGDLWRRSVLIRLRTDLERPDQRTDFAILDILDYVRRKRGALVADALTILRGFVVAGYPRGTTRPWGSFEQWSKLVVGSLEWSGLPGFEDPSRTQEELRQSADGTFALTEALHEAWLALCEALHASGGVTLPRALDEVNEGRERSLRHVLEQLDPRLTTRGLAKAFQKLRGRIHRGRRLVSPGKTCGAARWVVEQVHLEPSPRSREPGDDDEPMEVG